MTPVNKKRYILALLFSMVILGCSLLIVNAMSTRSGIDVSTLKVETIILVYISIALIYIFSTSLWLNFSSANTRVKERTIRDSILDTGLIAIGKYIPGKIWGILARGAITNGNISVSRSSVVASSFEQAIIFGVGIFLTFTLLVYKELSLSAIWMILPSLALVIFAPTLLHKLGKRWPILLKAPKISPLKAGKMMLGYTALWTLTSLPILIILDSQYELRIIQAIDVVTAFTSAMLAGWTAFFAPGGIGVREAAFAAASPEWLSWQDGLLWVALHRTLYTVFDLAYGSLCLLVISYDIRRARADA